ncbi:MAG TPA: hypothetical protein VFP54_09070 [Acidimicrobiales bacterium]|nr:hypothetical protein [Acidimicrobiales bacterium]
MRTLLAALSAAALAGTLAGCGNTSQTAEASVNRATRPPSRDVGEAEPTTAPQSVGINDVVAAVRAAGVKLCDDDKTLGTSGDVATESNVDYHYKFGTNSPTNCDTTGVGELVYAQYQDLASAQQAGSLVKARPTYVEGFRCGEAVVTVDDKSPTAVRAPVARAIGGIGGCLQLFSR